MKKICIDCKLELELEFFSYRNKLKNIYRNECKKCFSNKYSKKHYKINNDKYKLNKLTRKEKNKEFLKDYLSDKYCIDCGNTDWRVLEFDHVRGDKVDGVFRLGISRGFSTKKLLEEIEKCEIRCYNCHRIVTYNRFKNCYKK